MNGQIRRKKKFQKFLPSSEVRVQRIQLYYTLIETKKSKIIFWCTQLQRRS